MQKEYFISVILPLKLEWEPCYSCSERLQKGDRVRVEFARKEYVGVVSGTDICPDIDAGRIKPVISVEKNMEKILEEEIEFWKQISQYYLCTIGEVYKAAYPVSKVNLEEARAAAKQKVVQRRQKMLEAIDARLSRLTDRLTSKTTQYKKAKEGTKSKSNLKADIEKITEEISMAKESRKMASSSIDAAKDGLTIGSDIELTDSIDLSEHQEEAYRQIRTAFGQDKPVLLHGATGSGKTEIYMKLAHGALESGKNVLYLVPEIALSRQLHDRLESQFGDRLLTFHSGESAAERRNTAEMIRNSEPGKGSYIALCTRSGLFLPHRNLGLIVVDEEHDGSYKQDSPAPRYNGRDAALILHRLHKGCNIVLGSATPSFEEIYNTTAGRHSLVRLDKRYHGSDKAETVIIDTKAERRKRGMVGNFSRKLIDLVKSTLAAGEQVLILRSRRAWASAMQCESCGELVKCPHCNVSMSLHKSNSRMQCHYCGTTAAYTSSCDKCGGNLISLGAGTQKIEEEAAALFPQARIARLDSDTAQNKKLEAQTIKDFADGQIDILIGTQIITKGFDFGNLGLVAIIAADNLLAIQDFRADEKALHLLEQFSGRCGRRDKRGLFAIQTSQPEHPIYQNFIHGDCIHINDRLMQERRDFGFPPYSRIIELTVRDIYEDRAARMASRLADALAGYNISGPYTPAIDKVADHYIRKIRISLAKDRNLASRKEGLKEKIARFEKTNRYEGHIIVDVDPA